MRLLRTLAFLLALSFSSQGFALIEGQLLVGQRSASAYDEDFSGTEMKAFVSWTQFHSFQLDLV